MSTAGKAENLSTTENVEISTEEHFGGSSTSPSKPKPLSKCKSPTLKMTNKQILYIIIIQGFVAAGISFAINYGIATAIFKGKCL